MKTWSCPLCTYENQCRSKLCEMCATGKFQNELPQSENEHPFVQDTAGNVEQKFERKDNDDAQKLIKAQTLMIKQLMKTIDLKNQRIEELQKKIEHANNIIPQKLIPLNEYSDHQQVNFQMLMNSIEQKVEEKKRQKVC